MAQHVPIQNFKQKSMRKIEESIRKRRSFAGSFLFEKLPDDHKETEDDVVYMTYRKVPKSILWFKAPIEVHTKPHPEHRHFRIVTNIYLVA